MQVVVRRVVGSGASSQGKGSAGDDRSRACSSVFAGPACCVVISAGQKFYEQCTAEGVVRAVVAAEDRLRFWR